MAIVNVKTTLRAKRIEIKTQDSGADMLSYENKCAFYEESMKLLSFLAHIIRFIFRCGDKLESTSESRHLGFFKMAAVKKSFSIDQLLFCFGVRQERFSFERGQMIAWVHGSA